MPRTKAKPPHLRAIPLDDESLMFDGEPAERIERIGEQLESIDGHFHAVHTFEPEVELVFASAENPFGEAFCDEEPVVDRFASMETNFRSRAQTVPNAESGELSALLSRYTRREEPKLTAPRRGCKQSGGRVGRRGDCRAELGRRSAKATRIIRRAGSRRSKQPNVEPSVTAPHQPEASDAGAAEPQELWGDAPTLRWADAQHAAILNPADDPVLPELASHRADKASAADHSAAGTCAKTLLRRPTRRRKAPLTWRRNRPRGGREKSAVQPTPENPVDEDLDLIIVEDDPPAPAEPQNASPSKVRRREFSQLFAQLRRG